MQHCQKSRLDLSSEWKVCTVGPTGSEWRLWINTVKDPRKRVRDLPRIET